MAAETPSFYDAPVSHERTPASEHKVRPGRAYLVLNDSGRVVAADDPSDGTPVGLLVFGTVFGDRLVAETPVTVDDVPTRRYGNKVTA